jgi:hypothetical protein
VKDSNLKKKGTAVRHLKGNPENISFPRDYTNDTRELATVHTAMMAAESRVHTT